LAQGFAHEINVARKIQHLEREFSRKG
jgi:hypothetical protein